MSLESGDKNVSMKGTILNFTGKEGGNVGMHREKVTSVHNVSPGSAFLNT